MEGRVRRVGEKGGRRAKEERGIPQASSTSIVSFPPYFFLGRLHLLL